MLQGAFHIMTGKSRTDVVALINAIDVKIVPFTSIFTIGIIFTTIKQVYASRKNLMLYAFVTSPTRRLSASMVAMVTKRAPLSRTSSL